MAKHAGWWSLVVRTEDGHYPELDEGDLIHIAKLLREGYTEGEICGSQEDEDEEE